MIGVTAHSIHVMTANIEMVYFANILIQVMKINRTKQEKENIF